MKEYHQKKHGGARWWISHAIFWSTSRVGPKLNKRYLLEKKQNFFFLRSAYRGCFFLRGFKVQFVVEVEGGVWLQDVLFCFKWSRNQFPLFFFSNSHKTSWFQICVFVVLPVTFSLFPKWLQGTMDPWALFRDMILDQLVEIAGYLLQTYDFASSPRLVLKGGGTLRELAKKWCCITLW